MDAKPAGEKLNAIPTPCFVLSTRTRDPPQRRSNPLSASLTTFSSPSTGHLQIGDKSLSVAREIEISGSTSMAPFSHLVTLIPMVVQPREPLFQCLDAA